VRIAARYGWRLRGNEADSGAQGGIRFDLHTLAWTRGAAFAVWILKGRLNVRAADRAGRRSCSPCLAAR